MALTHRNGGSQSPDSWLKKRRNTHHNKAKTDSVSANSVSSNSVSANSIAPTKTEKTNSNNFSKSTSIAISKNSNSKNIFLEKIKTIFHTIF